VHTADPSALGVSLTRAEHPINSIGGDDYVARHGRDRTPAIEEGLVGSLIAGSRIRLPDSAAEDRRNENQDRSSAASTRPSESLARRQGGGYNPGSIRMSEASAGR
jgi:hypothetical protein